MAKAHYSCENHRLAVVLPVHGGADPTHLRQALLSIYEQTHQPDEILVVKDGPLPAGHKSVLEQFHASIPRLQQIQLPSQGGVARACQAGVEAASSPWVARMDADDIADPRRLEVQMAAVQSGGYDIVGSAMLEFDFDPEHPIGLRRMPERHADILRSFRSLNPFNHPTVVFRRELALAVGGYHCLPGVEDYDLFARMCVAGARMYNIEEPLLRYRANPAMLRRRRSWLIIKTELTLQRRLVHYGLINWPRAILNLVGRTSFRLLPPRLMRFAYRRLFHDSTFVAGRVHPF